MQPIQKISFKAENSNLLQSFVNPPKVDTPVVQSPELLDNTQNSISSETPQLKESQPIQDTFQKKDAPIKSFVKEYGGVTALAVSILGIPAAYFVAHKANTKAINNVREAMSEVVGKLNIDEKISHAVETALKTSKKPAEDLLSKKTNLTTILLGIGTGVGIGEFIKNNRDKLKAQGYTDDEITDAGNLASGIVDSGKNASNKADDAYRIASGISSKADSAERIAYDASNIAKSMDGRINDAYRKSEEALRATEVGLNPIMQMYTVRHYDLNLLQVLNYAKKIDLTR